MHLPLVCCVTAEASDPGQERNVEEIDATNRLERCEPRRTSSFDLTLTEEILELKMDRILIGMSAEIGFLDNDPYPDIFVVTSSSNLPDLTADHHLTYLYGSPSGEFTAVNGMTLGTYLEPYLVDVNDDNVHDVVNMNLFALSSQNREERLVEIAGSRRIENSGFWVSLDGDDKLDFAEVAYGGDSETDDPLWNLQIYPDYFWNRDDEPFVQSAEDAALYFQDFDGDGSDDLITRDREYDGPVASDSIGLRMNRGAGERFESRGPALAFEHAVADPFFGDFDCDGQLEIVVLELDGNNTEIWQLGSDAWQLMSSIDGTSYFGRAGDLNGDGSHDLVIGGRGMLRAYLGDGGGGFSEPIAIGSELLEKFSPSGIALGDVDGNGMDDIVAVLHAAEEVGSKAVLWRSTAP